MVPHESAVDLWTFHAERRGCKNCRKVPGGVNVGISHIRFGYTRQAGSLRVTTSVSPGWMKSRMVPSSGRPARVVPSPVSIRSIVASFRSGRFEIDISRDEEEFR